MILRNLLITLITLFLCGCGYQSIYSNNNKLNLSIGEIFLKGDLNINRKVLSLTRIREMKEDKANSYDIKINSEKINKIIAKDSSGNASIFKMIININVTLIKENQKKTEKLFTSSFIYNNSPNKFDLTKQKNTAKEDLVKRLAEKIIVFINTQ